jgi:hypothetical protein
MLEPALSRSAISNPELDAYLNLMGKVPDEEIASMAGVSASKVARARRRLNIKLSDAALAATAAADSADSAESAGSSASAGVEAAAAPPAAEAAAEEPAAAKPATERKSKLAAFADIIGVLPDREVAERASATIEAVRMYRKRHNIPAPAAAEAAPAAAEAAAPAPAEAPASAPVAESAPAESAAAAAVSDEPAAAAAPARAPRGDGKPGRRQSRLDPYLDLVGKVPDAEVAQKAGVTPENVRAFRNRHGIAAYYRLPTVEGEPSAPPRRGRPPKARVAAPAAAAPAPVAAPESPKLTGGVEAWALKSSSGRRYVVLGAGFAAAAVEAVARLASADPGASVLSLERVGVALA